jgi:D-amino peptidase
MEGLDESFDAVIFVGYHAKADAPRGLFAHTGSGVVRDLQVNGVSVGEGGMNAAMAAWYGVAVALVTGDDAAVEEVKASAPNVRTVAVKRAINTRAVELLPLAEARRLIEEGARQAVAAAKKPAPVRTGPYKVTMRFRDVTIPEVASAFREVERPAPDTVAFARDAMPDAYRLIRVFYRYFNTD